MPTSLPYSVYVDRDSSAFVIGVGFSLIDDVALWTATLFDDQGGSFTQLGETGGVQGSVDLDFGLGSALADQIFSAHFQVQGPIHFEIYTMDWTIRVGFQAMGSVAFGGTAGADILLGGALDDQLSGLAGVDYLDGGAGNDTMTGGADNDVYVVDAAGDQIVEDVGGGFDRVTSTASFTLLANVEALQLVGFAVQGIGNGSDNLIVGTALANTLSGLDGADTLQGQAGDDRLIGGAGTDLLDGGAGTDRMEGGTGNDSYIVTETTDRIVEVLDQGDDTVTVYAASYRLAAHVENLTAVGQAAFVGFGNDLANIMTSGAGNDALAGREGDDILDGGAGNDRLFGGAGADLLLGGAGRDFVSYSDAVAAVTVNLLTGLGARGDAQGDRYFGIESAVGGLSDDFLLGNATGNSLIGGDGRDRIEGGDGADLINGGQGRDFLVGDAGIDTLSYAGSLNGVRVILDQDYTYALVGGSAAPEDFIDGFENVIGTAFADVILGDAANNVINGGALGDSLAGGAGIDTLSYAGSAGGVIIDLVRQVVSGGDAAGDRVSGFENAFGGDGNDRLTGTDQANLLYGGAGNDGLAGGAGNDTLRGGAGADTMFGGAGTDTLSYTGPAGAASLTINLGTGIVGHGDAEGDVISGFENVIGSDGTDYITGDIRANRITGGAGFDILRGGAGNDTLSGGGNGNQFVMQSGDGRDIVTDFDTESAGGFDVLSLKFGNLVTFEQIMAAARATGVDGQDLIFTLSPTDSLTLLNVSVAELLPVHLGFFDEA